MIICLKITFVADLPEGYLQSFFQKHAKQLRLEGTAQVNAEDNLVKLVVCGPREPVDEFVDLIHKNSDKIHMEDLEIEPFIKDKDYRGVFRVIE